MVDINEDSKLYLEKTRRKNFVDIRKCPKCNTRATTEKLTYYDSICFTNHDVKCECTYIGYCDKCNIYFKNWRSDTYNPAYRNYNQRIIDDTFGLKINTSSKDTRNQKKVYFGDAAYSKDYDHYKKLKEEETFETKEAPVYKGGNAIATVVTVLAFCFIILSLFVIGCSVFGSTGSSHKYEPTTGEVLEWYDKKDSSGNYVNRGEYNTKRSY